MLAIERYNYILKQLKLYGSVNNNDLINALKVSQTTILRDLQELEFKGKLTRIHGGAQLKSQLLQDETIQDKIHLNKNTKQEIAEFAASLVPENATIYLDAGTTTLLMIPHLKQAITVVTNSIIHAYHLLQRNISCLILGGTVKPKTSAVIGINTYLELAKLRFDFSFVGTNGIDQVSGFTTPTREEGEIKKLALKQAKKSFIIADHTKFGKTAYMQIANFNDEVGLITDICPKDYKEQFSPYLIFETSKMELTK